MKKILTFKLFEAQYDADRMKSFFEPFSVSVEGPNSRQVEEEIEYLAGRDWKSLLMSSIEEEVERRILRKIKSSSFEFEQTVLVPISFLTLEFNGKVHTLEIFQSTQRRSEERGSQIWAEISGDRVQGLKIFDKDKSFESLIPSAKGDLPSKKYYSWDKNEYIFRVSTREKGQVVMNDLFVVQKPGEDFKVKFYWDDESKSFLSGKKEPGEDRTLSEKSPVVEKTIYKGKEIGLIIKSISPEKMTYGKIQEIVNLPEIKEKQKMKSIKDLKEIKLSFLPHSDVRGVPYIVTLKEMSKIGFSGAEYEVVGKGERNIMGKSYSMISSNPSSINEGKIQIRVRKINPV